MNVSSVSRYTSTVARAALLCLTANPATAQTPAAKLPPSAAATLSLLDSLHSLPETTWRMHAGDLPHGEDPSLNDSSWAPAKPHQEFGAEAIWLRSTIEVPRLLHGYDLTGARIWFQLRASANGPIPMIVYFDGRRVAMGDDLERMVLFEHAQPGQRVVVAVKLLYTIDTKRFQDVTLTVDAAPGRPEPNILWTEASTVAQLLPLLQEPNARAVLTGALSTVDTAGLAAGQQAAFDKSLTAAETQLDALAPEMNKLHVDLVGNAHIDAAWLWPWTETVDVVKRTFSTALQLMAEYPQFHFTQSAAAYNEWLADKYPGIDKEIKARIQEGRWEVVGGMWVEPDLNLPDGESQVRQLLLGTRFYEQHYGAKIRIGWNPDSFGYNWQLPQIYKRSGLDFFVTQKMHWNDTNQLPFSSFWWQSPDGSRVLTYFPTDYVHTDLHPYRLAKDFVHAATNNPGITADMDLYGVGDHGGGPTRTILDEAEQWMKPGTPVLSTSYSTAQHFFDQIQSKLTKAPVASEPIWNYERIAQGYHAPDAEPGGALTLPVWKDELYFEYHRGVFTTQAAQKRNMRKSEVAMIDAETTASLGWLRGEPYPSREINAAWKKVAFNQFHDLAAGSGIADIYRDAQADYDLVFLTAGKIKQDSLQNIAENIDTQSPDGVPVLVFNSLGWARDETVPIHVQLSAPAPHGVTVLGANGKPLLSQVVHSDPASGLADLLVRMENVPSVGYTVIRAMPAATTEKPVTDLHASGLTLENGKLRVVVEPKTGCITSLMDLRTHFESIASGGCGNQLQFFHDLPKDYDAWNIDPGTLDHAMTIPAADRVELIEHGPLHAVIRVTQHWQSSTFVQDLILDAGSDHLDIHNEADWHETHILVKAAFPLAATSANATYNIPFGSIARPTTRNNSWENAKFEVPALRWADLGDGRHGVSLINESKYGYDAVGNLLRLSLLRSPTWPDPDADRGHHSFSYAVYPHAGDWRTADTVHHGFAYNAPLLTSQIDSHPGGLPASHSFVAVAPGNVVLTAVKKAEDGNALIFRMYEAFGKEGTAELHVPPNAAGAELTNLMEKPLGQSLPLEHDTVKVPYRPYEIITVAVRYAPAAAATGTIAAPAKF
jgi:alpha-mannosidase